MATRTKCPDGQPCDLHMKNGFLVCRNQTVRYRICGIR